MIMCANGVSEQLIVELFQDAIKQIKGLKERVMARAMTKEDFKMINICSDVS